MGKTNLVRLNLIILLPLLDCNGNPAKFWKTVYSLKGSTSSSLPQQINSDTGLITGKNAIIDEFNHHFISEGYLFEITSKPIHNDIGLDADRGGFAFLLGYLQKNKSWMLF